jgi:hypothetical protein
MSGFLWSLENIERVCERGRSTHDTQTTTTAIVHCLMAIRDKVERYQYLFAILTCHYW